MARACNDLLVATLYLVWVLYLGVWETGSLEPSGTSLFQVEVHTREGVTDGTLVKSCLWKQTDCDLGFVA